MIPFRKAQAIRKETLFGQIAPTATSLGKKMWNSASNSREFDGRFNWRILSAIRASAKNKLAYSTVRRLGRVSRRCGGRGIGEDATVWDTSAKWKNLAQFFSAFIWLDMEFLDFSALRQFNRPLALRAGDAGHLFVYSRACAADPEIQLVTFDIRNGRW
jgi:hypothetical protein